MVSWRAQCPRRMFTRQVTSCSLAARLLGWTVQVPGPQQVDELLDSGPQVAAVGTEGKAQHLCGPLLGGGRPQVGTVQSAGGADRTGVALQHRDRVAYPLDQRLGPGPPVAGLAGTGQR